MIEEKASLNQISLLIESARKEKFKYHEKTLDDEEVCETIWAKLYRDGNAKISEGKYRYFLHLVFHDQVELQNQIDRLIY